MTLLPFKFNIGADPEFSIVLDHKRISADKLITTLYKKDHEPENSEDSSEDNMGFKIGKHGAIGWDGVCSTGELRPAPSNNPLDLVNNIGELIKSFSEKAKVFELKTTSEFCPIGGHIHFELPKALHNRETAIDNLHKKLSSFYLPLLLSEETVSSRVRQKLGDQVGQPYGKITDYRYDWRDKDETVQTLELRTPSAEWLTSPEVARAIICYISCVFNEIIYQPKSFKKSIGIQFANKSQSLAMQSIAMSQFTMVSKLILGKIKYFVRKFEFYPQFKKEIELALNPEKMLAIKRKAEFDMIKGWGLVSLEPTKRQLLSEYQLKKEALKTDLDSLTSLVRVPYNPDTNVELFAKAMKERIIAMNWKPKNTYYLFGLRTGINNYIIINRDWQILAGQEVIKTKLDYNTIERTFQNMMDKFNNGGWHRPDDAAKAIYVGIPYDKRVNLSVKEFIEILWKIEKNQLTPKPIVKEGLIDDTRVSNKNNSGTGRIFQVYNEEKLGNLSDSGLESEARRNESLTRVTRQEVEAEMSTRDELAVALSGNTNQDN